MNVRNPDITGPCRHLQDRRRIRAYREHFKNMPTYPALTGEGGYENYAADNELTLPGYNKLGRVRGVIDTAVKQAFAAGVAKGELPKEAKAQLALARAAFIPHLAQVNAAGQFMRRVATLEQIPAEARPLIDSFAEQRLLIKDRRKDVDVVEVAHEALLRQPPISEWLEEDREFLIGKQQLQNDLRDWQEAKPAEKGGALLTGLKLSRMRAWLEARPHDLIRISG